MKKVRIILAVVLVIMLSIPVALSVYAQGFTDYHTGSETAYCCADMSAHSENNVALDSADKKPSLDNGASTRGVCDKCYGGSEPVCLGDMILMEEGYHSLGIFGFIMTDCYAYLYGSYGEERCYECGNVLWPYDGLHMCFERHMKCSKGDYDVCYMVKDY